MPEYTVTCPAWRADGHCNHHGCSKCCLLCGKADTCQYVKYCKAKGYAEWVKHVDGLQPIPEEGER